MSHQRHESGDHERRDQTVETADAQQNPLNHDAPSWTAEGTKKIHTNMTAPRITPGQVLGR